MNDLVSAVVSDATLVASRRKTLVATATQLFLKQGFHKTTVREIAAAAGWQMGTLYLYVKCKEDVLFLILADIGQQMEDCLLPTESAATVEQELSALYVGYVQTLHRLRREIRLIYRESASLKPEHLDSLKATELAQRRVFEEIIERGVDAKEFRPGDSVLRAQTFLMLASMWPLKRWALGHIGEVEEYANAQLEMLLRDLRTELASDAKHNSSATDAPSGRLPLGPSTARHTV